MTGKDVVIVISIGDKVATVNGKEVKLDSPAFIEKGRTYTPVRFISEELGASFEWTQTERKVIITKPQKNNSGQIKIPHGNCPCGSFYFLRPSAGLY